MATSQQEAQRRDAEPLTDGTSADTSRTNSYFATIERLTDKTQLSRAILREALNFTSLDSATRDGQPELGYIALLCGAVSLGKKQSSQDTSPSVLYNWLVEQSATRVDSFINNHLLHSERSTRPAVVQSAEEVIRHATSYSQATKKNADFSARHLIAALIMCADHSVRSQIREELGIDILEFRPKFLEYVSRVRSEEASLWPNLLRPRGDPTIWLSGFTSDASAPTFNDTLGINSDVKAFARLICLEQATPPLSICLFGEWGSGKSTFMERIQQEIRILTKANTHRPALNSPQLDNHTVDEARFIADVVQIRFNAWHFADANLWASLTAVFFDQLRRGGYDGGRESNYQALISRVADRVRSLEADANQAEKRVDDAKRKHEATLQALATAEKQLSANEFALLSKQIQDDLERIRKENGSKLNQIDRLSQRDDLAIDAKSFTAAVVEAAAVSGKLALIGRVLIGGGAPTYLAIVAIALVGIGLQYGEPTSLAALAQRALGWAGGALAALLSLWKAFDVAKPILDGAWKYAKAVETAREKLSKEVQAKQEQAKGAAETLALAESALAAAREPLLAHGGRAQADAPGTILRYFLFEDTEVRDYDKHVGIVSRARRSFEQLNAIVTTARLGRQVAEKADRGEALTPDEQNTLSQWRKLLVDDKDTFAVPDRIVLYIDDLDRCTHEQVYAVLQATHLLLAFELFVVVVGVDVQWIEGAVAKHFEADLATPDGKADNSAPSIRRRRAIDYLEKIFQIPFWLEKLKTEDINSGASGGTYAAYVRELLKENEIRDLTPATVLQPDNAETTPRGARSDAARPDAKVNGGTDANETVLIRDEFGAVQAALASMRLEKAEIDILASPEIGQVASKSPRAVKRLINVYRIVRARLSDTELEAFLGHDGRQPLYPIAAILAAIETGQPVEVADAFYVALKLLNKTERLEFISTNLERQSSNAGDEHRRGLLQLKEAIAAGPSLVHAIRLVDRRCGAEGTVETYLRIARTVRRYSFNKYY